MKHEILIVCYYVPHGAQIKRTITIMLIHNVLVLYYFLLIIQLHIAFGCYGVQKIKSINAGNIANISYVGYNYTKIKTDSLLNSGSRFGNCYGGGLCGT